MPRTKEIEYVFLSFRDPRKNLNLGVAVIKAGTFKEAVALPHKKGVNPGGEVLGTSMTAKEFKEEGLDVDRLYSRAEMIGMGYVSGVSPEKS